MILRFRAGIPGYLYPRIPAYYPPKKMLKNTEKGVILYLQGGNELQILG